MAAKWRSFLHKVNKDVKTEVKKEKKKEPKDVKILLLGGPDSGKSTLMKQLKIIHGPDYTEEEKMDHRQHVYQNILKGMKLIVEGMSILKISYIEKTNVERATRFLKDVECEKSCVLHAKFKSIYVDTLKALWADRGIQECFLRRREFSQDPLADSVQYFCTDIDRIAMSDYERTDKDFLRTRIPRDSTEGMMEVTFEDDEMRYKVVEVGGGKTIKSKFMHCFEDLTSIIFMVALSDYDCKNRMEDSLTLFKNTVGCSWLKNSTVIIILNKKDLFAEKLQKSHLADYFPDYKGPKGDPVKSREFILRKFIDLSVDPQKVIYSHATNLTVTEQVGFVLAAVKDSILQRNVEEYKLA